MTEDDTFKVLNRIPFIEMKTKYHAWLLSVGFSLNSKDWDKKVDTFFQQYKWTYYEYVEYRQQND